MTTSKWRGHSIKCVNDVWIYSDNKQPVSENRNRACGHCGSPQTKEGHDGCIETLEGAMNACCGHGETGEAYVQYPHEIFCGEDALKIIKANKEKGDE